MRVLLRPPATQKRVQLSFWLGGFGACPTAEALAPTLPRAQSVPALSEVFVERECVDALGGRVYNGREVEVTIERAKR